MNEQTPTRKRTITIDVDFVLAVADMMKKQRQYFKYRRPSDMRISMEAERDVVRWLKVIENIVDLIAENVGQEKLL